MTRHLLVIGAQRCGTTYLHTLLDAHPQITMARPARPEPKVFLSEATTSRGHQWYLDTYFGHRSDEVLLGEKSTSYIEDPDAPARTRGMLGDAEIVVLLRDPVRRAVSNWAFSTDNGLESRTLEVALRENLAGSTAWDPAGSSVSPFAYLERGRFADYLEPWSAAFPGRLHVCFLPDLLADDDRIGTLYGELGVDLSFRPADQGRPVNQSHQDDPELPADLVEELSDYFAASDLALARLVGRDLPWRHDDRRHARG